MKDYIGFTVDVKKFINLLCQDPTTHNEVLLGIQEAANAPLPTSTALGAANLAAGDGNEPLWCTLFVSSVQGKNPGDAGLFYRNDSNGGKGDRIQMRIKKQVKRQEATSPGAVLTPAAAPIGINVPGLGYVTPEQAAALLAGVQLAPAPAPEPQDAAIPADIKALIGG